MIATNGITTTTHSITASYTYNETYEWYDIEVDGSTLDEIVAEMLELWNGQHETVEPFTADDPDTIDGATVVGLRGRVRADDPDGFPSETETDSVYVLVSAEPYV